MARKRANGTEVTKGGDNEIRPVYRVKCAGHRMSRDLTDRVWHLFLENGDDNTEYPASNEQDCVMRYHNSPVASNGAQGKLTTGADSNIDRLPEAIDDIDNLEFEGPIEGESSQRVDEKRRLRDFLDERRVKKRMLSSNVTKAIQLA